MGIFKKLFVTVALMSSWTAIHAANIDTDNDGKKWELSFGLEGMSFYSNEESGLGLSKSPFKSYRTNLGAAASIGYWWSPNYGLRTKMSGYWGKAIADGLTENNTIRFYAIQEQAMFNVFNIIRGYDKDRIYTLLPYIGLGFMRNCTFNANALGLGVGLNNVFRISNHLGIHFDLSANFAGKNNATTPGARGKYKYLSAEIGLTFNLGRMNKKNIGDEYLYNYGGTAKYNKIKYSNHETDTLGRILANNYIPEGMVLINRGHIRMGDMKKDSLWGVSTPIKDISVDDFFMDKTEVTNKMYHSFINDVVDSIIAERMKDPYYMGDINKVKSSLYITNPITGEKTLDGKQLIYVYETYDEIGAAMRQHRFDPKERNLNTDINVDPNEVIMISKDTAYVDNEGNIIRETITRPLSSPYDFLNTYVVNICPDTTCWVNDFPKSDNSMYMKYYFSNRDYENYPVVGVTWEQANAYCAWRTEQLKNKLGGKLGMEQPYRLPTEAEWEYAARGKSQNEFPWEQLYVGEGRQLLYANFQPDDGDYTKDGNIITAKVATYPSNSNGLFDMAGNVAEWTSTAYTDAGIEGMNNINPQHQYNAAYNDLYKKKRKTVKGGSWKDSESHIKSAWRTAEYQNQPRSYIGFRCVRSIATKPSERTIIIKK